MKDLVKEFTTRLNLYNSEIVRKYSHMINETSYENIVYGDIVRLCGSTYYGEDKLNEILNSLSGYTIIKLR